MNNPKTLKPLRAPRVVSGGQPVHPFIHSMLTLMRDRNKSDLARHMGIKPQSLYKWQADCRRDPQFLIPLQRAIQAAAFFGVHPRQYRPDVVWPTPAADAAAAATRSKSAV